MIVGILTTGSIGYHWIFRGHRWRKASFVRVNEYELRSTKGWRLLRSSKSAIPEHLAGLYKVASPTFVRTAPVKEREGLKQLSEADMEKAFMRHRERRRDRQREQNLARMEAGL